MCKYRYVTGKSCEDDLAPGDVPLCEFHLEAYREAKESETYTSYWDNMLDRG